MTIMSRSAYKFWHGKELPREIAFLSMSVYDTEWQITTYKEVLDKKRAKQNSHLEYIRQSEVIKPCFIWTFYNEQSFPYGGWWLYIKTLKEDYPLNFRNEDRELQIKVMKLFPCGMLPMLENIEKWMEEFAKIYHYPSPKRSKQGMAKAWAKIGGYKLIDVVEHKRLSGIFTKQTINK